MKKFCIATVTYVILCLFVAQAQGQIVVTPAAGLDFGNVPVGTTPAPTDIVTVTNDYTIGIQVSGTVTGSGFNLDSPAAGVLFQLLPGGTIDFSCEFSPLVNGYASGVLTIEVRDFAGVLLETVPVNLVGTGGEDEDPCELVAEILNFYNQSIADGDLEGTGYCPSRRVRAMRCRIKAIGWLCNHGYYSHASYITHTAILRSDGEPCPSDFVQGTNLQSLNNQLVFLQMLLQ